jgi:regulatory protein
MGPTKERKASSPLDESKLNELALRYVGRFATTRAKLQAYLRRKLRERGWNSAREPDPAGIAERFADQGYVDDSAYALSKSQSLTARGYGLKRVAHSLRVAGVDDEQGEAARHHAEEQAVESALSFARRRRIGPFAEAEPADGRQRDKALAAMVRAGHSFALARAIIRMAPGTEANIEQLNEFTRLTAD